MPARHTFDYELQLLNLDLVRMGSLIETAIENAIDAFKKQDEELAKEVIKGDREVDKIEKQIEARCLSLILREQPVAGDLRKISTALKMITDMERIGDNASDIAELSLMIRGEHIYTMVEYIPKMSQIAIEMVHGAVSAFVGNDLQLSERVMSRDDELDKLFDEVKRELVKILQADETQADNAIDFLMIAKYLERVGDHAVNICEWVEFSQTGEHKHVRIL